VSAPGYVTARRTIDVASGGRAREQVRLEAEPIAVPPTERVILTPLEIAPPARDARMDPKRRTAGILALGGAGVLGVAGLAAWRLHDREAAIWDDNAQCRYGSLSRDERCHGHATTAQTALGVEIGAFAGAAVVAGIGAWLLWGPQRARDVHTACGPALSLGIACQGTFE